MKLKFLFYLFIFFQFLLIKSQTTKIEFERQTYSVNNIRTDFTKDKLFLICTNETKGTMYFIISPELYNSNDKIYCSKRILTITTTDNKSFRLLTRADAIHVVYGEVNDKRVNV